MRWVSSHLRAILKLADNWPKLVKFLYQLLEKVDEYSANTIREAKMLLDWITNKHFLSLLHYNIDIQQLFKFMSQANQRKYDSVIGHSENREYLATQLTAMKTRSGERFESFLEKCHCVQTIEEAEAITKTALKHQSFENDGCEDMNEYESSFVVYYNFILHDNVNGTDAANETLIYDTIPMDVQEMDDGVIDDSGINDDSGITDNVDTSNPMDVDNADENVTPKPKKKGRKKKELHFEPLSTIRVPYVETILANLDKYFPSKMLKDFDIFDQRNWDEKISVDVQFSQSWRSLRTLVGYFKIPYKKDYFRNFKLLAGNLMNPDVFPDWCTIKANLPSVFWMRVLGSMVKIDDNLRHLIRILLVIPPGSSEAERAFR